LGAVAGIYKFRDSIFGARHDAATATSADDPEAAAKHLHAQFEAAQKQIVAGDYAGAMDALKKLNDENDLTQPLQNWVTIHEGLASLLQENLPDARDWFKVVGERSHFSNDPSDSTLVNFFSKVGGSMASATPISAGAANGFAPDSIEAFAPFLFALKDWALGKFTDSGKLLATYLGSDPKDPFQWVAEYKPIAQKYADDEAAYEKAAAAVASAATPDQRADALKQVQDLEKGAKGKMAEALQKMEQTVKKKSAELDATYNQQIVDEKQHDQAALLDAKNKYAALCADYQFDQARAAVDAAAVTGTEALQEKAAMLKKADWLRQFKAQLILDINAYGYPDPVINRTGGRLPDGPKKATDTGLLVQTQFGTLPFPWNTLPASALLAMANQISQNMAATAPQQAADRQWLSGVFACEEGMSRDGRTLLVQASQVKDEYKDQLSLFMESE
jgi:hypothetical protein